MRGVVFTGDRELELMPFSDPTPDAHDVVIEMKASGMCGSDLHQYRRPRTGVRATGIPAAAGPVIAGHEPCGIVVAVGSAGSATVGRALYGTWNGRRWSLRTGPHITQLNAVSFDGRKAIWAVGSEITSDQAFRPVVQVNG